MSKSQMISLNEGTILDNTPYTGHYEFCVWKCHKPVYRTSINEQTGETSLTQTPQERWHVLRRVNHFNLFETLDGIDQIRDVDADGNIWRGVKIRTIRQRQETLSEQWEKEWQLLYLLNGLYYFAEPKAQVYECDGSY